MVWTSFPLSQLIDIVVDILRVLLESFSLSLEELESDPEYFHLIRLLFRFLKQVWSHLHTFLPFSFFISVVNFDT